MKGRQACLCNIASGVCLLQSDVVYKNGLQVMFFGLKSGTDEANNQFVRFGPVAFHNYYPLPGICGIERCNKSLSISFYILITPQKEYAHR